jgi:hypothetical protein
VCFGCWSSGVFCVRAGPHPNHAVARLKAIEFARGAQRDDCSFCFAAEDFGFLGRIETCAIIAISSQCYGLRS